MPIKQHVSIHLLSYWLSAASYIPLKDFLTFVPIDITITSSCNILGFFTAFLINDTFQMKNCDIFLIFAQNIDCVHTEAVLTCTHNLCFGAKIKKILYTLVNPSFTL